MLQHAFQFIFAAGCFGILTSTVFVCMVVVASWRFRFAAVPSQKEFTPPVSILKPLHGDEPQLEQNLRTFFEQDYPNYELLFCARTEHDAGLAIARKLAAEHPQVPSQILFCGAAPYVNAKVFSLETMQAAAQHDIFVVSDSDVRVTRGYLRAIVLQFAQVTTGLVTCLYRGVPVEGGLWARLEAIGMSVEMSSGVMVSQMLGPVEFALGPTMAARRAAVELIGGFRVLGPYCSDDFLLGNWIARAGWRCELSHHVIDHMVLNESFAQSVRHQVRWMKSTRASLPKGHFGTGLTFKMPFGIVALLAAIAMNHTRWGVALFLWAAAICCVQACAICRWIVHERRLWLKSLLFCVRDAMGFGFWLASYGSRKILWRGEVFELQDEGKMRKVHL